MPKINLNYEGKDLTETEEKGIFSKIKDAVSSCSFLDGITLSDEVKVNIMIHDMLPFNKSPTNNELLKGEYLLGQDNYESIKDKDDKYKIKNPYPTIHISLFDFFDDSPIGKKILESCIPCLPRYKKVIDSNIWNYYVPYHKFNGYNDDSCFKKRLQYAIKEICKNYAIGLYEAKNAKEKAEFTKRLTENSYIHSIGGHGKDVAPFVFHSETEMRKKAIVYIKANGDEDDCELEKLKKKGRLQWRILIVDDHATEQSIENKSDTIPKCKIINNILSDYFNIKCHRCEYEKDNTEVIDCWKKCKKECQPEKENITIWFDCAITMEDAIGKLAETKYDLILMDYLLNPNGPGKRNYAYDFLHKIEKCCKKNVEKENGKIEKKWTIKNNKIGPNGKFQMFYISAFTNTVIERMVEQGLNYVSEHWHISHGACPTTTPYLFLFYLLRRMNTQIKEFTKLPIKKQLEIIEVTTLLDLLLEIYGENKKPREQAIRLFNPLLKLRLNYDNLKYDVCDSKTECRKKLQLQNASALITSLFPDIPYYNNAFWEHIMHLVYLTAFGTIRQWHDMWEEFMLIKPYLQEAKSVNKKIKDRGGKEIQIAEAVINGLEKYITDLQNQGR